MLLFPRLNHWLDKYDPYWYSRFLGLKATYIAVILFIANMFFQPPLAPLIMLVAAAGVLIIEMPTINTFKKKDLIYLGYLILISITIGLFSSYVYFKLAFVIVVAGWAFILYTLLSKAPQLFPIVSVLLMLGIMSLEGINTGNFYVILNILMFIWEFAFISFWAHKLFPNLYHRIWRSSIIRGLESMQKMLEDSDSHQGREVFRHYLAANNVLRLLKKDQLRSAVKLTRYLSYYHYYLADLLMRERVSSQELGVISRDIELLFLAVELGNSIPEAATISSEANSLRYHYRIYANIKSDWNKLCQAVSS